MAGRSPARFLAPLALVVFAIAFVVVVGSSTTDSESKRAVDDARTTDGKATATPKSTRESNQTAKTYTVKPGDTPSGIAEAHGITVGDLLDLNPDVDPANLKIGAKLKVR